MKLKNYFKLGASIYVPSIHKDISLIANEEKIKTKSVIFCTEDSISEHDIPKALENIQTMLLSTKRSDSMMKFIRVRNTDIFEKVLQMNGINNIDGFVFPKITSNNILEYTNLMDKYNAKDFFIMPTLETREAFCTAEMNKLKDILLTPDIFEKVLSLRIGGNDLLNILGIRRSKYRTIYETPLGVTISNLVTIFKPHGFNLTAPVCEFLHDNEILQKEIPSDLEYGLFGKTAIHPNQVPIIETSYMVSKQDLEMAEAILSDDASAVFQMHGTMCEVATHTVWAKDIKARYDIYGVLGSKN